MDFLHEIVMGLLCGGAYWLLRNLGWFENRSKVQQALIFLPAVFVIVFVLNLIWPSG